MNLRVPARLAWATTIIAARSPSRILEIGCGRGVAIERLTTLLPDAQIVGIDRSEVAVEAATQRNREALASGQVFLQHADLASAHLEGHFDAILAVNVNVFWTTGSSTELACADRRLSPGGLMYLVYEPPSKAQGTRIEAELTKNLLHHGLRIEEVLRTELGASEGLCVVASRPQRSLPSEHV